MFEPVFLKGEVWGYSRTELGGLKVWEVAVRLGYAEGSDGYPRGARQVHTPSDVEAIQAARDGKPATRRFGRLRRQPTPQTFDSGEVLWGGDAL